VPRGLLVVAMKMCAVFEMMRCLEIHVMVKLLMTYEMNIQESVGGMERREISLKDLKICSFDIGGIDLAMAREWEWEWVKGRRLEVGD